MLGRSTEHPRNYRSYSGYQSGKQQHVQILPSDVGTVRKELTDINLGADTRTEDSKSFEISNEKSARDQNPLRTGQTKTDRNRRQANEHQCAHDRGSIQKGKVARRQPASRLTFGNARPKCEACGQEAQGLAARKLVGTMEHCAQHPCKAVSRNQAQTLNAPMAAEIDLFKPR
jgi:hypothetical protein